jgi:hypothetical protein
LYSDDGQTYDERLAKIRGRMQSFEQNNPLTSAALQAGGGITSAIALPGGLLAAAGKGTSAAANTARATGQALSVAPKGAGIMAQSLRAGGQGAGYGAAYGAGNAEGGAVDRLEGALGGGIIGLAAGLAAPPVINLTAKGLQFGIEQVARLVPEAWKRSTPAQRKVVEALLRDGLTPEQAALKMQQNPNFALVDVGPNTQGLARAAGTIPGEGKTTLTNFLRGRQEGTRDAGNVLQGGQINRIVDGMNELVPENMAQTRQAIEKTRKGFGVNYTAARNADDVVDVMPVLSSIDDEIATSKGGIKTALEKVRSYLVDSQDRPEISIDSLHQAKMAIDDLMSGEARTSMGNVAKSRIRDYQDRLIAAIESSGEAGAQYQTGRLGTAGQWRLDDALEAGSKFMRGASVGGVDDLRATLAKFSPEELHAFRIGAVQSLRDKTGDLVTRADATKRLMDIPNLESKIYQAFDDPEMYKKYIAMLQDEGTMFDSYGKVLTGSRTGEVAAEQADSMIDKGRIAQGVAELAGGRWLSGGMDIAGGLKDRALMSPETSKGLAELLSGRDTAGLAPAALKFAKNDAQRKQLVRLLMQIGAVEGGRAQGQ